jgi:Zn ribbon nucleic-acid-binding protein
MTAPKSTPCPKCRGDVSVWTYEDGWRRAECDKCDYIAEPAENIIRAIRNHNERAGRLKATGGQP